MQAVNAGQRLRRFNEIIPFRDGNGPYSAVPIPRPGLGTIWGLQKENQSVDWWRSADEIAPGLLPIPDPDAWYIGDLGGEHTVDTLWSGGGSDGFYNYFAVIGETGEWYVDKFNASMTELLERFPIEGWSSRGIFDGSDAYLEQNSAVKHLSARGERIVTVAQQYDGAATNAERSVRVAVLDLTGTTLHSHEILTFPTNSWERLEDPSSSCIDADVTKIYFAIHDWDTADTFIVNVDLETGVAETMYDLYDVNNAIAAVDATWFGYAFYPARALPQFGSVHNAHGLLATPDGDLIISSGNQGMMRVRPDGTPVWWKHFTEPAATVPRDLYDGWWGLAHSGRDTFWASRTDLSALADEYTFDGEPVQTIQLPYPALHAWLVGVTVTPRGVATPTGTGERLKSRHDAAKRGER